MTTTWKMLVGTAAVIVGLPVAGGLIVVMSIALLDRSNGTLVSSGEAREYLLHVPSTYDASEPTPLVISLHAGAAWPAHQKNLTRWNRLADEFGFIVVYPAGRAQILGMARVWHTFESGPGPERDVQFVSGLIDQLQSELNIDATRIYADGMSNGGGMAYALSCSLSTRIAAVGVVAPAQSLDPDWCDAARPVPVMAFHGDADRMVPYHGGRLGDPFNPVRPVFPPIRDFVARWAERNGCSAALMEVSFTPDANRLEYAGCREDSAVVLYTLVGGGHSWPGGKPPPEWRVGKTNMSVDATSELWNFFQEHRLASN